MKNPLTLLLALCLQISLAQKADSLKIDSAKSISAYQLFPGMPLASLRNHSAFVVSLGQSNALKFNSGVSVLNNLRGMVPGLDLGASQLVSSSNRQLVVDGVALNQNAIGSMNLNSFEFSDINVLTRENSTTLLGGNGAYGAIALTSKTGRGMYKPTIEFNSFSSMSWLDNTKYRKGYLSNTLAYSQDFGKLDLRVSANNITEPQQETMAKRPNLYQFKINAGYDFNSRLSARLIVEHTFNEISRPSTIGNARAKTTVANKFLNGNLMVDYRALDWLSISAQAVESRFTNDNRIESSGSTAISITENTNRNRQNYSIFANAQRKLSKDFSGNLSIGVAYEVIGNKQKKEGSPNSLSYIRELEMKRKSLLSTMGIGFRNYAFINSSLRWDKLDFSAKPSIPNQFSYSAGGTFIFSDAFKINSKFLGFGKLRGSYGINNGCACTNYPYNTTIASSSSDSQNLTELTKIKLTDVGTDLAWFNNRLTLTYNFYNKEISNPSYPIVIDPSTGYVSTYTLNFSQRIVGNEIILGGTYLQTKNWRASSSLIWNKSKISLIDKNKPFTGPIMIPGFPNLFLPDNNNLSFPSTSPDWTGSILSNVSFKNFSLRLLVDYSKGGHYLTNTFSSSIGRPIAPGVIPVIDGTFIMPGVIRVIGGNPLVNQSITINASDYDFSSSATGYSDVKFEDSSFAKLREVSLGYQVPLKWFKSAFVSVSGRNLFMLYSKSGADPEQEELEFSNFQKEVNLNFLFTF